MDNTYFTGKFKIIEFNGMPNKSLVEHLCGKCNHYQWWVRLDIMVQRGRSKRERIDPKIGCPYCSRISMANSKVVPISTFKNNLDNK